MPEQQLTGDGCTASGSAPATRQLMTVRAVEVIGEADVVAYHSARHGRSIARSIAAAAHPRRPHRGAAGLPASPRRPPTIRAATGARWTSSTTEAAARLAAHLDAGRTVAVLAEGDPLFYGSYQHMHKRLADRYADRGRPRRHLGQRRRRRASARPLVEAEEVLTILPGTLPEEELTARLAATDSAVVMKLGRTFPAVRSALRGRPGG